jgi:hypothetical protein
VRGPCRISPAGADVCDAATADDDVAGAGTGGDVSDADPGDAFGASQPEATAQMLSAVTLRNASRRFMVGTVKGAP